MAPNYAEFLLCSKDITLHTGDALSTQGIMTIDEVEITSTGGTLDAIQPHSVSQPQSNYTANGGTQIIPHITRQGQNVNSNQSVSLIDSISSTAVQEFTTKFQSATGFSEERNLQATLATAEPDLQNPSHFGNYQTIQNSCITIHNVLLC